MDLHRDPLFYPRVVVRELGGDDNLGWQATPRVGRDLPTQSRHAPGRVLLTGASGFLGRHAIGPLIDMGYEVHAVGSTVIDERARWYRADLLDQAARRGLVAAVQPQALLHCAWVTQHGAFWTAQANLDWVAASLDLARAVVQQGARRMLFVGSCAEYDWSKPAARPWLESDPCQPTTLYGIAKHAAHQVLRPFAASAGVTLIWARLFHLYGPHEAPGRLVPAMLRALRAGARFSTGPAETVRDLLHVADAGQALAGLLDHGQAGACNVASGQPVSMAALAGMAAALANRHDLVELGARPSTTAEPAAIVADVTRLRATGFVPSIRLNDGLAALWNAQPVVRPTPSAPSYNDAADLYRAGRRAEAETAVKSVLARQPDDVPSLNLLGVLRRQAGDPLRARACLERAATLDPGSETAWINLGNVMLDLEDAENAIQAYSRGLAAAPARSDTRRLLGNALSRAGRDSDAIAHLDAALAASPRSKIVLRDRARAHFAAGRFDIALADIDIALRDTPQDNELLLVRAQMRRLSGNAAEAMAELRDLIAQAPENADAQLALADALLAQEDREAANGHYRQAVALRPDDELPLGKLCWSLLNSRYGDEAANVSEAAAIARKMLARGTLQPANAHAVQSALMRVADLDGMASFDAIFPDRRVLLDFWVRRNVIGALHAQLGRVRTMDDRLTLVDRHRQWGTRYEARVEPLCQPAIGKPRGPARARIRVGFVSSDLRNHPVSYFALPIFEQYDRDRFEVFAYSFHPGQPDPVQRRIEERISKFRRLPNRPEREIAQRIADDGLDILFELGGSTHLNRLEVMAHRPAPVQVSWLGYPHSSGLGRIDHILVDPYLRPPDPRLLIERGFEMPSSWVSLGRLGFGDHPIAPGLPADRQGHFTFGTMNNPYKYAPETFALWAAVMNRVPGSRFLFVRPESGAESFRANVARAFAAHGIAADRLDHRAQRGQHMPHYNDIDIALDTAPQTGGTTTCECLWMGVPTISLVGPAFFERLSFSNLVNAGLRDLATDTPSGYVAAAVGLAADARRRRALRHTLRDDIRRSALGDTGRWVRDFEALILRTLAASTPASPAPPIGG
jgi:predicted O-linked N-acetylglucosamine transferase (SPINDLY family)/nucleoside-diphosphate-sugar epimerase